MYSAGGKVVSPKDLVYIECQPAPTMQENTTAKRTGLSAVYRIWLVVRRPAAIFSVLVEERDWPDIGEEFELASSLIRGTLSTTARLGQYVNCFKAELRALSSGGK